MGHSRLRRDNHGEGLVSDLLDATPTETNRGTTVRDLEVGEHRHNTTGMAPSNDNNSQEGVATDLLGVDDIHLQAGVNSSNRDNNTTGHRAITGHKLVSRVEEWDISVHSALRSGSIRTWFRLIKLQLRMMTQYNN